MKLPLLQGTAIGSRLPSGFDQAVWMPRLALLALWLLIILFISLSPEMNNVRPSDDMFYIDAAWKLQAGEYTPPTPNTPYHHYLRWPVVLPLSLAIGVFGSGSLVVKLFGVIHLMIASLAVLLILQKTTKSTVIPVIAAGLTVFLPVDILSTRVLSEPVASAWFLVGLAIVALAGSRRSPFHLVAAGICAAIAINAAQVSVFSAPVLWYFAWQFGKHTDRPWHDAFWAGFWLAVGAIGMYATIMCAEWIAFGDPLIQIKAISFWHFKSLEHSESYWSQTLNQGSDNFLFGYTIGLFRHFPAFAVMMLLLLGVALRQRSEAFTKIIVGGLIGLALLEVFSILVVDKIYTRFIVIPLALLLAGSFAAYLEASREPRNRITIASTAPLVLISMFLLLQNNLNGMKDDNWTVWYQSPFAAVNQTVRQEKIDPENVEIVIGDAEIVGLIPWRWAANVYTNYSYRDAIVQPQPGDGWSPASAGSKPVSFLITSDDGLAQSAMTAGYETIAYPFQSGYPRPVLLVRRSGRID